MKVCLTTTQLWKLCIVDTMEIVSTMCPGKIVENVSIFDLTLSNLPPIRPFPLQTCPLQVHLNEFLLIHTLACNIIFNLYLSYISS